MSNQIEVLVPNGSAIELEEFLASARTLTTVPFAQERIDFISELSGVLLKHPIVRSDPAGVALGFWLRRANVNSFADEFRNRRVRNRKYVSAGLVYHVTPANVDTMFLYSWALSFIAGNVNIVRLTTRASELASILLECLNRQFCEHEIFGRSNWFISYQHDEVITTKLSEACDVRFVWGGDETVRRLRKVPLSPHASERSFASKRSLSIISAKTVLSTSDIECNNLAIRLAADIAPFGQMACSSPHVIYWVGNREECWSAAQRLDIPLETAMASKVDDVDKGWAIRRINYAFSTIAEGSGNTFKHMPHITRLFTDVTTSSEYSEPCGAGFLFHTVVDAIGSIPRLLRCFHQTVTYYGFTEVELDIFALEAGRVGVDRVVPIGRALDFGPYWDGYDLWSDLTRIIVVQ